MPRLYHSASSLKLGSMDTGCEAAWGYNYLLGQRELEIPWAEIEADPDLKCSTSQRSTALGKAMHTVGQLWYQTEAGLVLPKPKSKVLQPDWNSFPGQVFHSGAHLLPHPHDCEKVWIEASIGTSPMPEGASTHAPPTRMKFGDIYLAGYIDLIAIMGTAEAERLKLPSRLLLADYKSCKTLNYALTPDTLQDDLAAAIYAYWLCQKFNVNKVFARWPYFETGKIRRATPVDAWLTAGHSLDIIEPFHEVALRLDTLEDISQCEQNTSFCGAYGGCPYHRSAGGDCDARRSIGKQIVNIGVKKMTVSKEQKDRFAAARAKAGKGKAAAPADEEEAPAEAKPARKPRPAKKAAKKNDKNKGKDLTELSTRYTELQEQLEAARTAQAEAEATVSSAEEELETVRESIAGLIEVS